MAPVTGSLPLLTDITIEDLARLREYQARLESVTDLITGRGLIAARDQLREVTMNAKEFREDFLKTVDSTKKYFSELSSEMDSAAQKIQIRLREINEASKKQKDELEQLIKKSEYSITDLYSLTPDQLATLQNNLLTIKNATGDTAEEISRRTGYAANAIQDLIKSLTEINREDAAKKLLKFMKDNIDSASDYDAAITRLKPKQKDLLFTYGATDNTLAGLKKAVERVTESSLMGTDVLTEYVSILQLQMDKQKAVLMQGIEITESEKLKNELQRMLNEKQKEELELSAPLIKMEQMHARALKEVTDGMSSLTDKMAGASAGANFFGSALTAALTNPEGGIKGIKNLGISIAEGLGGSFLKPELAANRLFNFLNEKLIKSTFDFNKIAADVNKQTGGLGAGFESVAFNKTGTFEAFKQSDLSAYGLGLKQFSDIYVSLSKNVGGFNNMLDHQRELLTRNAASLTMLGVSSETYSKLTSTFMGTLNKTAEAVKDNMNDIARDALGLGKSVADYTAKLEQSMRNLVGYGKEATEIFRQLAGIAQATNNIVSESDLIAVSDKFKTFNTAASAVSNLNALLKGTSVNILDMMRADPSERIMMMKRAAESAGLEFGKLNYGYKSLLAETFFGGDIAKAQAFFDTPLEKMNDELNKSKATEEELKERREASAAAQEKLTAALDNMKIALTPVLTFVNNIAKGFMELNKSAGGFGGFIAGFALLLAPVVASFIGLRSALAAPFIELRRQLDGVVATLIKINLQMQGLKAGSPAYMSALDAEVGRYSASTAAARAGPTLGRAGMVGGALVAGLGLVALLGSSSEKKEMDDGVLVFNQGRVDGYRINDNDVAKMMIGTPTGPLNESTNFINDTNMSSVANQTSTNISNNFLESYFNSQSPLVLSLEKLTNVFTSVYSNSDSRTAQLMSNSEKLTELVQTNNQSLQTAAVQQSISTSAISTSTTKNESVSVIGGGAGGGAGMNFGDGLPVKMDVTLNANFTKLVDVVSDEVFARMRRKV